MSDAATMAELGAGLDRVRAELCALEPAERSEVVATWRLRARCRPEVVDVGRFFPTPDGPLARTAAYSDARPICDRCEVWAWCLHEGLADQFGYRGRATPAQRRKLRLARGERRPRARP